MVNFFLLETARMHALTEEEYQRRKRFVLDALARNPTLTEKHFRVACGFGPAVARMKSEGVKFGRGYAYGRNYKK